MRALRWLLPVLLIAPALSADRVAIEHVHLITLDGGTVLFDHALLVEDGRIAALVPMAGYVPSEGARRIDGGGGYLIPGLVDSHVHLEEYMDARPDFGDAPLFLRYGITSIFNLRGFPEHLTLRDRIARGELLAPTLYTSGEFVNEPRINTPEEAGGEVRAQAAAGYDMLKFREVVEHGVGVLTTHGVDRATFDAVHREARAIGMPVLGHAPHGLGLVPVFDNAHTLAHMGELVQLHFFPRLPSTGFRIARGALLLLTALILAGALLHLLRRRAGGLRLAGAALLVLLPLGAALLLSLSLMAGGLLYGSSVAIAFLGLLLVLLAALGAGLLLRAARPAAVNGPVVRSGFAVVALCALTTSGFGMFEALPMALRGTPAEMARVAERLAASGALIGTTLVLYDEGFSLRRSGGSSRIGAQAADAMLPEFRERFLGARAHFSRSSWRDLFGIEGWIPRYDHFNFELARALHQAGVPLMAGTDAYGFPLVPPGRSMHAELEILVETVGLSPHEALLSATVVPARFLGREDEFGRLAPGLRADAVLLAANPLEDIRALREPRGVLLRGHWLGREDLDAMLAGITDHAP